MKVKGQKMVTGHAQSAVLCSKCLHQLNSSPALPLLLAFAFLEFSMAARYKFVQVAEVSRHVNRTFEGFKFVIEKKWG